MKDIRTNRHSGLFKQLCSLKKFFFTLQLEMHIQVITGANRLFMKDIRTDGQRYIGRDALNKKFSYSAVTDIFPRSSRPEIIYDE